MGRLRDYKNSFFEVYWITKSTLATFWFWAPILYMTYVIFQLWLMFYVHPATLAIFPLVLIVYGMRQENKRLKTRYGLVKTKRLRAEQGLGTDPEQVKPFEWKVEQAVEQYEQMLEERKKGATEE
jgi:hypothetical protein